MFVAHVLVTNRRLLKVDVILVPLVEIVRVVHRTRNETCCLCLADVHLQESLGIFAEASHMHGKDSAFLVNKLAQNQDICISNLGHPLRTEWAKSFC